MNMSPRAQCSAFLSEASPVCLDLLKRTSLLPPQCGGWIGNGSPVQYVKRVSTPALEVTVHATHHRISNKSCSVFNLYCSRYFACAYELGQQVTVWITLLSVSVSCVCRIYFVFVRVCHRPCHPYTGGGGPWGGRQHKYGEKTRRKRRDTFLPNLLYVSEIALQIALPLLFCWRLGPAWSRIESARLRTNVHSRSYFFCFLSHAGACSAPGSFLTFWRPGTIEAPGKTEIYSLVPTWAPVVHLIPSWSLASSDVRGAWKDRSIFPSRAHSAFAVNWGACSASVSFLNSCVERRSRRFEELMYTA